MARVVDTCPGTKGVSVVASGKLGSVPRGAKGNADHTVQTAQPGGLLAGGGDGDSGRWGRWISMLGQACGSLAVGSRKAGDATLIYSTESGGRSQGHALRFSGVPGRHSPSFPVHTLSSALCCPAWLRVAVSAEA